MLYHDLPEEITCWRRVWDTLNLGPAINGHPLIVYQSALLLNGRALYQAAELAFREVLLRRPDHVPSLKWVAILLQHRGRNEEAASFLARAAAEEAKQRAEEKELAGGMEGGTED
jgi:tetratricopeptide (TPR) repeat protein